MRKYFALLILAIALLGVAPRSQPAEASIVHVATISPDAQRYAAQYGINDTLAQLVIQSADRYQIPRRTAFRLVNAESNFTPTAVSPVGAIGLAQVMPATAALLQPGITERQLFDPATNLDLGFRFLADMRQRYHGDMWLALVAYNSGPRVADTLRDAYSYSHRISRP